MGTERLYNVQFYRRRRRVYLTVLLRKQIDINKWVSRISERHDQKRYEQARSTRESDFCRGRVPLLHRELTNSWLSIFRGSVHGISGVLPCPDVVFHALSTISSVPSVRFLPSFEARRRKRWSGNYHGSRGMDSWHVSSVLLCFKQFLSIS